MLSSTRQLRLRLTQGTDGLIFALCLPVAYWLRASFPWWELAPLEPLGNYLWLTPVSLLLAPALLENQGLYHARRPAGQAMRLLHILEASVLHILCLVLVLFLARIQCARSVIITGSLLGGILVYLRTCVAGRTRRMAPPGRSTLWVGSERCVREFRSRMSPEEAELSPLSVRLDPTPEALAGAESLIHREAVGQVVMNLPELPPGEANRLLALCEEEGIEVILRPGLGSLAPARMNADVLAGEPVLYQGAQDTRPVLLLAKRLTDRSLSLLLLLGLSPLLLLLALLVRLDSPGPVIFRQRRAGLNGRPFVMYKFRSMRAGSEEEQEDLLPLNEMKGPVFKLNADPRITRVGRILRRHGLDELPQLINVLKGEMSLVGPRPLPLSEVDRIRNNAHRRRLSVRPGLTCLWQVSGRNDIHDFEDWVKLDLEYIDRWSPWLDFIILLRTIPVVLFGRGGR